MHSLDLHLLTRDADGVHEETAQWIAGQTAIIVCDMWDRHWCRGASMRVDELAPFMERVLTTARAKGVFIVHAPSDTMEHYVDHPGRLRAVQAPRVELPPVKVRPAEPSLPIDDSDQGCMTEESRPYRAWSCQHPAITIAPEDAISDESAEIFGLFAERGIDNVLMMGVHTNMCILGRPFGLRRLVEAGLNVALVRDLTDSMYNPARAPFVSHFEGTARVVAHIETYLCPSVTSTDLTGDPEFRFREDA